MNIDLAGMFYPTREDAIEGAKRACGKDSKLDEDFVVHRHWASDSAWTWHLKGMDSA
jgi:hypothetical protein